MIVPRDGNLSANRAGLPESAAPSIIAGRRSGPMPGPGAAEEP